MTLSYKFYPCLTGKNVLSINNNEVNKEFDGNAKVTQSKTSIQYKEGFGIDEYLTRHIMEFVPNPRALYNLSMTNKLLRSLITTELVVKCAMYYGGHAFHTIFKMASLVKLRAIYPPSSLRWLRLTNGRRCEFCFNVVVEKKDVANSLINDFGLGNPRPVQARANVGVFACYVCMRARRNPNITKTWTEDAHPCLTRKWQKANYSVYSRQFYVKQYYLVNRYLYFHIFSHPRILARPHGNRLFTKRRYIENEETIATEQEGTDRLMADVDGYVAHFDDSRILDETSDDESGQFGDFDDSRILSEASNDESEETNESLGSESIGTFDTDSNRSWYELSYESNNSYDWASEQTVGDLTDMRFTAARGINVRVQELSSNNAFYMGIDEPPLFDEQGSTLHPTADIYECTDECSDRYEILWSHYTEEYKTGEPVGPLLNYSSLNNVADYLRQPNNEGIDYFLDNMIPSPPTLNDFKGFLTVHETYREDALKHFDNCRQKRIEKEELARLKKMENTVHAIAEIASCINLKLIQEAYELIGFEDMPYAQRIDVDVMQRLLLCYQEEHQPCMHYCITYVTGNCMLNRRMKEWLEEVLKAPTTVVKSHEEAQRHALAVTSKFVQLHGPPNAYEPMPEVIRDGIVRHQFRSFRPRFAVRHSDECLKWVGWSADRIKEYHEQYGKPVEFERYL